MASTKDVLDHHLKCFDEGNLKGMPPAAGATWGGRCDGDSRPPQTSRPVGDFSRRSGRAARAWAWTMCAKTRQEALDTKSSFRDVSTIFAS
jgi:hypothetical protein